ncbi:hypothetical protein ACFV90_01105 [Streptomyces sp. NPDC059904]
MHVEHATQLRARGLLGGPSRPALARRDGDRRPWGRDHARAAREATRAAQ